MKMTLKSRRAGQGTAGIAKLRLVWAVGYDRGALDDNRGNEGSLPWAFGAFRAVHTRLMHEIKALQNEYRSGLN